MPRAVIVWSCHCVKSVQTRSFIWSVFSPNAGEYGPEKTPYLDTFHAVCGKTLFRKTLHLRCLAEFWISLWKDWPFDWIFLFEITNRVQLMNCKCVFNKPHYMGTSGFHFAWFVERRVLESLVKLSKILGWNYFINIQSLCKSLHG